MLEVSLLLSSSRRAYLIIGIGRRGTTLIRRLYRNLKLLLIYLAGLVLLASNIIGLVEDKSYVYN